MITTYNDFRNYINEQMIIAETTLSHVHNPEYLLEAVKSTSFGNALLETDFFNVSERKYLNKFLEKNKWEDIMDIAVMESFVNEGIGDMFRKAKDGIVSKMQSLWNNVSDFSAKLKDGLGSIITNFAESIKKSALEKAKQVFDKVKETKHQFDKKLLAAEGNWFKKFFYFLSVEVLGIFQNLLEKAILAATKENMADGISMYGMQYINMITENEGESKGAYSFILSKIENTKAYQILNNILKATKDIVEALDNIVADKVDKTLTFIAQKSKSISQKAPEPPQQGFTSTGIIVNTMTQVGLEASFGVSMWTASWQKIAIKTAKGVASSMLAHGVPAYYIVKHTLGAAKWFLTVQHVLHLLNIHIGGHHHDNHDNHDNHVEQPKPQPQPNAQETPAQEAPLKP